jgi:uncharacterized zinc-type alcohol dehydrogenase-like protein
MIPTVGYAAPSATAPFERFDFDRRDVGANDVHIDILYCGVCHSDLHTARGEWPGTVYPCVPGHEIIGRVVEAGASAGAFKTGDLVGVGCLVDSCQECASCAEGLEQYCEKGMIGTYNAPDKHIDGAVTYGGYSKTIVVDQKFVLRISDKLDPAAAAPLLCAGITTWSPLRHWNVGPGHRVGVVGLGGLGHMAIKLAHALGAHVTLFTTSPNKRDDAIALGADEVVISKDADAMAAQANTLDFIIDTVAAPHDLDAVLALLKRDGVLTLVGAPPTPHPSPNVFGLIMKRRSIAGSLIGGLAETQEMLDFCAEHGIVSEIEQIRIQDIDASYERMLKSDVKYRFVIDMKSLDAA